jgi:hypothetical protein
VPSDSAITPMRPKAAFACYAAAGMHVVRSADPIEVWSGLAERASTS